MSRPLDGQTVVTGTGVAGLAAGGGVALLAAPEAVLRVLGVDPGLPRLAGATRVLGARHLLQAAALVVLPQRIPHWVVGVDAVHAVSMLGLAATSPRYRRVALVSAGVAALGAVLTWRGTRRTACEAPGMDPHRRSTSRS